MENSPDAFALLSELGASGALIALVAWFGKRFLALHDRLLEQLERVIEESLQTREAMDSAREAMQEQHLRPLSQSN